MVDLVFGTHTADFKELLRLEPDGGTTNPKAMRVIVTNAEEHDVWMRAPGTRPRRCSDLCVPKTLSELMT